MSTGFGARPDGGAFHYRQEQDIQALKLRLHRYIIDEIDEDGMNLLEGARSAVVQYVSEKVCEYGSRHQLAISRYELDRLAEEVVDELTGFGPLEILLRDPGVSEILVNGPGRVFVEREGRLYQSDLRFIDDHHVLRVIQRILAPLGRRLDESSPMVDARLPDGSRVNAIIPPVALDGPCISIRKFSQELLRSADLLAYQSVDEALLEFLRQAVSRRCNILISGGTGTGKTTLLNVISGFIDERERIVTIEDTAELQLGHDHVVRLETRPPNAEGYGEVTARDLIRNALRMRPDRIILGEIRGVEVLDVLQAMNRPRRLDEHGARQLGDGFAAAHGDAGRPDRQQAAGADLAPDDLRRAGRGGADHPPGQRSALHQRSAGGAGGARRRVRHQYPVQSRPAR